MFALATEDIKRLPSWLAADTYYQQTAPIRGSRKDYRPIRLNRRDHRHKQLRKYGEGDSTYYAARLYRTDLVEYHRDHIILDTTCEWTSNSTVAFVNAVIPYWLNFTVHKDKYWVRIDSQGNPGSWFMPDPSKKLKIMVDPTDGYKPVAQDVDAMKVEMRRVDRKAANQLYKSVKDYFQWAHMIFEIDAAEQMVAMEMDYPVNIADHKPENLDENGQPKESFWQRERNYVSNNSAASARLAELVSGEVNPDDFPKILTLSLSMSRAIRTWYRRDNQLFNIDTSEKAHKAWLQKFIVDQAQAYKWEHRPNDGGFPSQIIRVNVSEPIRVGGVYEKV